MNDKKQHPSDLNGQEDAESLLPFDNAEVIYLSNEDFDALLEILDNPKPPSQALKDLVKKHALWNKD